MGAKYVRGPKANTDPSRRPSDRWVVIIACIVFKRKSGV